MPFDGAFSTGTTRAWRQFTAFDHSSAGLGGSAAVTGASFRGVLSFGCMDRAKPPSASSRASTRAATVLSVEADMAFSAPVARRVMLIGADAGWAHGVTRARRKGPDASSENAL